MKKTLSIILSICMLLSITAGMDFSAYAWSSGECGDKVNYEFDPSTGTLTISGQGSTYDYDTDENRSPFDLHSSSIKRIVIKSGTTSIGKDLFRNCSSVTEISLPNTLLSIGDFAFEYCSGLTNITIPNSVTRIGDSAFEYCSGLINITIPNSVTRIDDYAFSGCTGLSSITIPNSVTKIGTNPFRSCSGLKSIKVNSGNTNYDSRNNCNAIIDTSANKMITGCRNTVIPNDITSIGDFAFFECENLTDISIPNSITSLGQRAFYGCESLASVSIPYGITIIEYETFSDCNNLQSVDIPNSVTDIEPYAFACCKSLKSITFPSSVTGIKYNAFEQCENLTSLTIPDTVTDIGKSAFWGCKGLTEVTIGNNISKINDSAFANCNGLTNLTLGSNVKRIDQYAFRGCDGLQDLIIPDSVTYIDYCSFLDCESLTNVILGRGLKYIGNSAFSGCKKLTNITIPENVTGIGEAFYECSSLQNITFYNKDCSISDSSYTIPSSATICGYSDSTAEAYASKFKRAFIALDTPQTDNTNPTGSISSTNNVSASQTATLTLSDNVAVSGYYWGTNSNYASNTYTTASAGSIIKTISAAGTYYLTVKDTSGNVSNMVSITYYKTTLNANGGSVSPTSVLTKSGNSFTFPTPTRSSYTYQGWNTSNSATSGVKTLTPSGNTTYYAVWTANSTSYTYSIGDVTYSFDNSNESFGYPYDYVIPYTSFKIIFGDNTYARQLYRWWAEDPWGGNCFGMALTSSMFVSNNDINVSTYKNGATKLSQLSPKDKGSSSINLTTFIEAMMVSQSDSSIQKGTVSNNLSKLYSEVENISKTGKPVPVGVIGSIGGHEILAYGVKKVSNTDYRIKVYDNNWPNQERYIYLTANSSGKFTSWKYSLWDGCTFSSSNGSIIDYTPYSVYYNVWKNGSNDGKSRSVYNTLITNSKNVEIYDFEDNKIATVENGELQSNSSEIYVVNRKGLLKNTESQAKTTTIVMPTDLYTVKNTDSTIDEFEATMINIDRASTVSTEANEVTFAVDDSCSLNNTTVSAKSGQKYSIILDSSDALDNDQVSVSGISNGQIIQASQIKGNISLNNCPGAKIAINGTDLSESAGETSVSGGNIFFEEKTLAYTGNAVSPKINVVVNGITLKEGIDYIPYYSNNTKIGTGSVVIYGIGDYSGTLSSEFNIVKAQISYTDISGLKASYEYTKKAIVPSIIVKYNGVALKKNLDYKTTLINNVKQGTATMIIDGVGNYAGSKTVTFIINCSHKSTAIDKSVAPTFKSKGKTQGSHCSVCGKVLTAQKTVAKLGAPSISKVVSAKKSIKASWKAVSGIDGYQIQYSLKKNMKSSKTATVKGASKKTLTVKSLKSKKTYYVRIRAYKKINGKTQYSKWSAVKKVKVK